jgi:hypothetical protein
MTVLAVLAWIMFANGRVPWWVYAAVVIDTIVGAIRATNYYMGLFS